MQLSNAWERVTLILVGLIIALGIIPSVNAGSLKLRSPAFVDMSRIPRVHVMTRIGGRNASIPLSWQGEPPGTKSFALSMVDVHPIAHHWVHWLVVDIPSRVHSLAWGASQTSAMPSGSVELRNSYGFVGYGGPQPPAGSGAHPYVITIYALDVPSLGMKKGGGLDAFKEAIKGHVLDKAILTGYYER